MKETNHGWVIPPKSKVDLSDYDPDDTGRFKDEVEAKACLEELKQEMFDLQNLLYADGQHALLVVLQGMDASGKDGTIRHVMSGVNPLGCDVTAFKSPSVEELAHDFLWRVHQRVPRRGHIGIFNRSHYEDVLIVRVHDLVPKDVWSKRYKQINAFERILWKNNTTILKFFLHISKDEQKERLQERIEDPKKHWKFNPDDLKEREHWHDYQRAYEAALSKTSTDHAPWTVVPANKKWYRNLVVAEHIVRTLKHLPLAYPKPSFDPSGITVN